MTDAPPPTSRLACRDHPAVTAVARCQACGRALCDACFRFRMNGRPACARCAYETATRPQRRASLAVSFLGLAWGGGLWLVRRGDLWATDPGTVVLGAIAAPVVAVLIAASARDAARPEVEHREPADEPEELQGPPARGGPYRAYARRALLAVSPRLSGKVTALAVVASLAATAVLLPLSLKLPPWIEAEIVLAAWWLIVAATLVVLLYRGFRLRDDYVYFLPWDRPPEGGGAAPGKAEASGRSGGSGWADGCSVGDGCSAVDGEGCLAGLAVALALAAAAGAAWVFVELAVPVTFLLTYWLFMRAVGRVANDRHGCEGRLSKALGWGALWSTIYLLPLAALTWAVHALRR